MDEYKNFIFNGMSLPFIAAFFTFAFMGMLFSMLSHYDRKRKKDKRSKNPHKFSFGYWIMDNFIRGLANIIVIFVVVRFPDKLPFEAAVDMSFAFAVGLGIDRVIMLLRGKPNVGIFQSNK